MIKSLITITLTVLFTASLSGQTVVKMAMPEQPDEALSVTTLFEEKIPLDISTYLGPMGYNATGGLSPYTWHWLENDNVLSTEDIALVTPTAGNTYSVLVMDKNNCSVTLPIEISGESLKNTGPESSWIVFSSGSDKNLTIKLNDSVTEAVTIQIIDIKGIKHFETRIAGHATIPLAIASGMYFVYVQGQNIQYVQKIMVP
jgi:hypothetical protein